MIKKLLLTFSFIALVTITYGGTTYAAEEGEKIVLTEELSKLNKLYIEGIITEEEFSKAKSILLDSDSGTTKKKEKKTYSCWKERFRRTRERRTESSERSWKRKEKWRKKEKSRRRRIGKTNLQR